MATTAYTSSYTGAQIDAAVGAVAGKADKIQEVNHGTSDTTFTLTANTMHIWGTVTSLTLSLPTDSNSVLDEFMFTFTSGSTATTLSLPNTVKWVQDIEVETNKTYQVSIVNNLAGWLTNGMPAGGGGGGGENNVIESISVNSVAQTVDANKNVNLQFKTINNESISGTGNISISVPTKTSDLNNDSGFISSESDPVFAASTAYGISASDITNWNGKTSNIGTITSVKMNGSTVSSSGEADLGTVITSETTLSKGTTTGSGNAVTDISVSGHTITLTKGTTFLTSSDTVTIYSGSSAPSSGTGSNGDIYIQTS